MENTRMLREIHAGLVREKVVPGGSFKFEETVGQFDNPDSVRLLTLDEIAGLVTGRIKGDDRICEKFADLLICYDEESPKNDLRVDFLYVLKESESPPARLGVDFNRSIIDQPTISPKPFALQELLFQLHP